MPVMAKECHEVGFTQLFNEKFALLSMVPTFGRVLGPMWHPCSTSFSWFDVGQICSRRQRVLNVSPFVPRFHSENML